jgi:hypothetical protein
LQNIVDTYQSALSRRFTGIAGPIDSQNFIQVAQLTRWRHAEIVNDLIIGLYVDNLWSLIQVLYPFIGGTAWSHSVNAKDPLQYQITWSGSMVHTAAGVVGGGGGGSGAGDTGLFATKSNFYSGLYVGASSGLASARDFGAFDAPPGYGIVYQWVDNNTYLDFGGTGVIYASTKTSGYKAGGQFATTRHGFENVTTRVSAAGIQGPSSTTTLKLGKQITTVCPNRTYSFAVVGFDITPAQHVLLYNRIQTYQDALGRAVAP